MEKPATAGSYFCNDFSWEDLREEVERLQFQHGSTSPPPTREFPERGTADAWNRFHNIHAKHAFFKERRYLVKEFPDLLVCEKPLKVLEVGCGTGSSVVPILRANDKAIVYACDCSKFALERAEDLVQNAISSNAKCRFFPFLCDISTQCFPEWLHCSLCESLGDLSENREELASTDKDDCCIPGKDKGMFVSGDEAQDQIPGSVSCCVGGVDIVMLIFTLSSLPPQTMPHVIKQCFSVLKPGGLLLFRDYGLYDMTMQRFSSTQKVGEHLYQRGDGTLSYFFTPDFVREVFSCEGFAEEEVSFCCVELKNHRKGLPMKRVWIHAKFSKPKLASLQRDVQCPNTKHKD